jgi:hypothetical protein
VLEPEACSLDGDGLASRTEQDRWVGEGQALALTLLAGVPVDCWRNAAETEVLRRCQ